MLFYFFFKATNEFCTLGCETPGYEAEGNVDIMCQASGEFTAPSGSCVGKNFSIFSIE